VVVLAAQHHLDLQSLELRLEVGDRRLQVVVDRLAFLAEVDESPGVVMRGEQRLSLVDALLQRRALLERLLTGGLVVPEARPAHLVVELTELLPALVDVKDTPGSLRDARRAARGGGPARRRACSCLASPPP